MAPVDPMTQALISHAARLRETPLASLASARAGRASIGAAGWRADLSRHRLDAGSEAELLSAASSAGLETACADLFAGAHVNPSEDRPALHWALRAQTALSGAPETVRNSLDAADAFAEAVRAGQIVGSRGKPFRTIVHIGIGGSDFGPRLLADAFHFERDTRFDLRFCANLDPIDLELALQDAEPDQTLVIGVSKSFGTEETLYNLKRAKTWLEAALGDNWRQHMALVTANAPRAEAWLGGPGAIFDLPESVGGRFSIWSAGSLACSIVLGLDLIRGFRTGAAQMDDHVRSAPLEVNLAMRLAALDVWNRSYLGAPMRVLLAYSRRLRLLPAYLQQLEMESNGKSFGPDGAQAPMPTAPALWGGEGSIGQHSYHQWLHQGSDAHPTEFVLALEDGGDPEGRTALTAHALAQAEVLCNGRSLDEVQAEEPDLPEAIARQKVHSGGRASSFLSCASFGPEALGALIALYEHRTYFAGRLWAVNSFDQWGVERGKTMAGRLKRALMGEANADDPVTKDLIGQLQR